VTSPAPDGTDFVLLRSIVTSHLRLTGSSLGGPSTISHPEKLLCWLDEAAPFGLLAHDSAVDPRFTYANATARQWFGYSRSELIGMYSRLSAGEEQQDDRDALLSSVAARGFATGYRGRRVHKGGWSFLIEDVTMWNVSDDAGHHLGQAALLPRRVRG